ncbi:MULTISPECIES: hypothetical protein [Klebsiella]|uniref:hypothetical protein n=1 Tax=Klebsiella TaxID=570 RepID=UPI0002410B9F|nr:MULTISPECIES: hypothetical protein [Klebsiella]MDU0863047.1 hypothetical protein [Serratia marcescens]EHL88034.1 hypothetical protein HMPREF1024_04442 [Klebsiella sp. 4_1_44FAA]MBL6012345.1 hypothetical protein [Klebsiella pneumoniae]MBL6256596.1 hypothetical protein [Klebsiella pneumoniae]MEC5521331.1 hypothetical protein [Klebsiella pneumoniae]
MTDITELAQRNELLIANGQQTADLLRHLADNEIDSDYFAVVSECESYGKETDAELSITEFALRAAGYVDALVEALEKAQQVPVMPLGLHPDTQKLVTDFCTALAEKLYKAQLKYGYDADWKQDGWPSQCQAHFHQHIAKGDPRDVAAYCAFMWWHGWSTKPAEGLESRTVTVKLPDYRNTYKSPLADEVEHQVRLALELFSSAAGIKVEAE